MLIQCRCGWEDASSESLKQAEVLADVHESADVRRPYRHGPRRGARSMIVDAFWSKVAEEVTR